MCEWGLEWGAVPLVLGQAGGRFASDFDSGGQTTTEREERVAREPEKKQTFLGQWEPFGCVTWKMGLQ